MERSEAIERIKARYDKWALDNEDLEALRTLIPDEYKETKEERIGKMLIGQMERWHETALENNVVQDIKDSADALTYLNLDFVSDWLRKHVKAYINSEYNEFHKTVEYDGGIDIERLITDLKNAAEKEELFMGMKQASQTMEEIEQQSLSNMSLHDFVTRDLLQYGGKDFWKTPWALDSTGMGYPLYCAKLGAKWQREQESVKWDESDDAIHTCVLGVLGKAFMGVLPTKPSQEHIEWFKSLPERFNLQPKQKWSEEDEQTFIKSVETLEYLGKFELANWLKDHKSQFLNLQNTWKPSKEEMGALAEAMERNDKIGYLLHQLHEELKHNHKL